MIVLTSRNSFYPSNLNILSLLPINRKGFLDGLWLHPCLWNGSFDLLVYLRVWSTVFFSFDIWSFWNPRFAVCDFTACHSVCLGLSWAWWLWSHSRNVVCLVLMSGKSLELDWKNLSKDVTFASAGSQSGLTWSLSQIGDCKALSWGWTAVLHGVAVVRSPHPPGWPLPRLLLPTTWRLSGHSQYHRDSF